MKILKLMKYVKLAKKGIIAHSGDGYVIVPNKTYKEMVECWKNKPIRYNHCEKEYIMYKNEEYLKIGGVSNANK